MLNGNIDFILKKKILNKTLTLSSESLLWVILCKLKHQLFQYKISFSFNIVNFFGIKLVYRTGMRERIQR